MKKHRHGAPKAKRRASRLRPHVVAPQIDYLDHYLDHRLYHRLYFPDIPYMVDLPTPRRRRTTHRPDHTEPI